VTVLSERVAEFRAPHCRRRQRLGVRRSIPPTHSSAHRNASRRQRRAIRGVISIRCVGLGAAYRDCRARPRGERAQPPFSFERQHCVDRGVAQTAQVIKHSPLKSPRRQKVDTAQRQHLIRGQRCANDFIAELIVVILRVATLSSYELAPLRNRPIGIAAGAAHLSDERSQREILGTPPPPHPRRKQPRRRRSGQIHEPARFLLFIRETTRRSMSHTSRTTTIWRKP